jgi:cation transport ATPase
LTVSLYRTGGNYLLPLGFAIGDFAVVILLIVKGKVNWGIFETVILLMVIACLAAWKLGGPIIAAISSTVAVVIAGIPGLREMWKKPQRVVGNIWMGYVLANVLSFFGGTAMTMKERFTPGVFAWFALLMFAASRRKKPPAAIAGGAAAHSPWISPH